MQEEKFNYYKIQVTNPFVEDSLTEKIYAVKQNDDYFEILTGKKIYILENESISNEVIKDDYLNKNCSLIGISKELCSDTEVSKYLVFEIISKKKEIIDNLNIIEQSIFDKFIKNKIKIR